jgi:hypothetical protein
MKGDFCVAGTWFKPPHYRGGTPFDTIMERGGSVIILDFYWLEASIYLVGGESRAINGYGNQCFKCIIPLFFLKGGKLFILPNDILGLMNKMYVLEPQCETSYLTIAETCSYNLLYKATESITVPGTEITHSTLLGVTNRTTGMYRTNDTEMGQLDPILPFIPVFNTDVFTNRDVALALLESMT